MLEQQVLGHRRLLVPPQPSWLRSPLERSRSRDLDIGAHHTADEFAGPGETGTDFVDEQGRPFASFGAGTDDTGGATAELEILRGQLGSILYERSAEDAEYVSGDQITALHDDGSGVDVEFLHGPDRRFDVVVIAEGLRSRTRALLLPDAHVHELGAYCAYVTIPRTAADDDDRWRVLPCGAGRLASLRPDNLGTTQALLSMVSEVRGLDRIPRDDLLDVLRKTFADVGWEVPRILCELDDDSLYFEALGQVRLPAWSRGRIALLGDAAYASSISGMGTTMAITGAYVLAGELTTQADPRAAFARYEQVMRPLVTQGQKLPPGAPRSAHPRNRAELAVFRTVLRVAATPLVGRLSGLAGTFTRQPAEAIALPDYPAAA